MERHSATLARETENDLGLQIEYLSFAGLNMPAVSIGMCGRNPCKAPTICGPSNSLATATLREQQTLVNPHRA